MREIEFLNIIHNTLHDTQYLGDDCAYLKELGIYVTQDTLVEDVHFSIASTSAFDLGYKAIAINLSDLAASASKPLYVTVSLSMPAKIEKNFVEELYKGIDNICEKYGVKVIGGDLTRSEKIFISVCAIGKKTMPYNVSRKFAKNGDVVITTGTHGDSAAGLRLFPKKTDFSKKHLKPEPSIEQSQLLAQAASEDFAMMDTSDGLADALYKIAKESTVTIIADFEKIPVNPHLKRTFPHEYKNLMLWGGEDFELVACVSEKTFEKLDKTKFYQIGRVTECIEGTNVLINDGESKIFIEDTAFEEKSYKHFEEKD